jgi:hypothetical protein
VLAIYLFLAMLIVLASFVAAAAFSSPEEAGVQDQRQLAAALTAGVVEDPWAWATRQRKITH